MEGNAEKAVRGSSHSIPIRGNKALTTSLFFEKALQRFFLLTYLITHCPDDYSI